MVSVHTVSSVGTASEDPALVDMVASGALVVSELPASEDSVDSEDTASDLESLEDTAALEDTVAFEDTVASELPQIIAFEMQKLKETMDQSWSPTSQLRNY